MVPHVAARGSSFKGAGLYYLHDKEAQTTERVAWVQTHNVPTGSPDKALKWMAWTAIHADHIKAQAGVSRVGRKATGKPVYAYSLSWHRDDQPSRKEMQDAAFSTLERLGLKDHEAVIVAHRDTDHPHVHVICNLVHPQTGKVQSMSNDRLRLSEWAQAHDKKYGRDHCPERVQNNQERSTGKLRQEFSAQHGQDQERPPGEPNRKFVKHRAQEDPRAQVIQELYSRSDSGKAFRAALQEEGYTLAQGHKGRIALVNEEGQVYNLARQLKGQRSRDIKARLQDVDMKALPVASELAAQRQSFDRDAYETEQQKAIVDSAIEAEKKRMLVEKSRRKAGDTRTVKPEVEKEFKKAGQEPVYDDAHLVQLDQMQAWERAAQRKRLDFEERMEQQYERKALVRGMEKLKTRIDKKSTLSRLTGKQQEMKAEYDGMKQTLSDVDMRIDEYRQTLEREIKEMKVQYITEPGQKPQQERDRNTKKEKSRDKGVSRGKGGDWDFVRG